MTVLADLKKVAPSFPGYESVSFNKTESIYTFPNGSTIEFMGGDEENRVHGFQGDVAHLNEPYKFSKEAFDQIDMRTTGYVLIDWNPKNNHFIDDISKRENAIVIHSTYKDNPFVPVAQRIKIESYMPVADAPVVKDGKISVNEAMYYDFSTNPYGFTDREIKDLKRAIFNEEQTTADAYLHSVYALGLKAEKPNRIFKNWAKITNAEFENLPYNSYFGLDFGSTNPSALIEMKYADGCFFWRKLMYKPMSQMQQGNESDPGGICKELELLNIKKEDIIIADSADPENRRKIQRNGYNIMPAKKGQGSVKAGIDLINDHKNYYVSDTDLDFELENYEWEVVNGVNLDRPIKKDDHLMDAGRYIHTWLCGYLSIK